MHAVLTNQITHIWDFNDNGKKITYRLKFIDSFRFMSTSLSSLVDNLSEKLYSDKCKDCKSELDYMSIKNN